MFKSKTHITIIIRNILYVNLLIDFSIFAQFGKNLKT